MIRIPWPFVRDESTHRSLHILRVLVYTESRSCDTEALNTFEGSVFKKNTLGERAGETNGIRAPPKGSLR
jgi:hypothetical protein